MFYMKILGIISLTIIIFCTSSQARTITGKVVSGKEQLSGVIITDGTNFTRTKKNGSFRMNIVDTAKFVYIITPSGYVADWSDGSPKFFIKAEGRNRFEFDLLKTGGNGKDYNLIAVGDPQPKRQKHFDQFVGTPLSDITETGKTLDGPVFGIVLGDICFDVFPLMESWKKEITRAAFPFYAVPGNHDHDRKFNNDVQSIEYYHELFGPGNYAFHVGKDLVIMLDNIIYHSRSGYQEGYTDNIITWVKNLLKYIPADANIYVAQHGSLNGRHYSGSSVNDKAMLDALKGRKVIFMSGHNHTNGNFEYTPDAIEHNIAAICGTWWDVYHCTDGTPRGYKVYTKKDGEISWYYKSIGKDKSFQHELFRPGECRNNPDCVVVNVWDYDSRWKIEWEEDGKKMGEMQRVTEFSPLHSSEMTEAYTKTGKKIPGYRQTRKSNHFFAAKPTAGASAITVIITDRFGNTWKEKCILNQ